MSVAIILLFIMSIIDVFTIIVLDCIRGRMITNMNKITDEDVKSKKVNKILKVETASACIESAAFVLLIVLFTISIVYNR